MTDHEIIELYLKRDEAAITETHNRYGNYLYVIANNILHHHQDSEECVNDTYYQAWNHIPPRRPDPLRCFLANIARNLALNRYEYNHADKRDKGKNTILDEIAFMLPHNETLEDDADMMAVGEVLQEEESRKYMMVFETNENEKITIIYYADQGYLSPYDSDYMIALSTDQNQSLLHIIED